MATSKHYSHITYEMRIKIENYVTEGRTIAYMARELDIDPTSISRELKRNRRYDGYSGSPTSKNKCIHRTTCTMRHLCDSSCRKKCSSCGHECSEGKCPTFEQDWCRRTHRAPYVCNGCDKRHKCPLKRYTYSAKVAQEKAQSRLVDTRVGLDMTGHEMEYLAHEVKEGIKLGQSVHHIFTTRTDLPCSERSFYRHVENEAINVRKMDLSKKLKYKKRNRKRATSHENGFYEGHEYSDFMALDEVVRTNCIEMDCVEGAKGDTQAFLTLHFKAIHFQIYILLDKKDSAHVIGALDWLEVLCGGKDEFKRVFGTILADRGSEFDNIEGIEANGRCSVYYTDPQRPDQKGSCEKNHVELRKIIPKGTSIDGLNLSAWDVGNICSHVNSSVRLSIGNATPMALAKLALPASLLDGLGLELIEPQNVQARPELIEHARKTKSA